MTDAEFLDRFERCTLDPAELNHRNHIRAAWLYLRAGPVLEALGKFTTTLRRYAASLGKPGVYHETITWSYLFIIHGRMLSIESEISFDEFAAENSDLFGWPVAQSVLASYYREETLASELARRTYLMPDRATSRHGR